MLGWMKILSMEILSTLDLALFQSWITFSCLLIGIMEETPPKCLLSLITFEKLYALVASHVTQAFSQNSHGGMFPSPQSYAIFFHDGMLISPATWPNHHIVWIQGLKGRRFAVCFGDGNGLRHLDVIAYDM